GFNAAYPKLIQLASDFQLLLRGEYDTNSLFAVAESCVIKPHGRPRERGTNLRPCVELTDPNFRVGRHRQEKSVDRVANTTKLFQRFLRSHRCSLVPVSFFPRNHAISQDANL